MPPFLSQELEAAPSKDPTKAEISILEQESLIILEITEQFSLEKPLRSSSPAVPAAPLNHGSHLHGFMAFNTPRATGSPQPLLPQAEPPGLAQPCPTSPPFPGNAVWAQLRTAAVLGARQTTGGAKQTPNPQVINVITSISVPFLPAGSQMETQKHRHVIVKSKSTSCTGIGITNVALLCFKRFRS